MSEQKEIPQNITSSDGRMILGRFRPEDAQEIFDLIDSCREHLSQHGEDGKVTLQVSKM